MIKYQPTPRECMLLILLIIRDAEARLNRSLQRVRITRGLLRRISMRERLSDQFMHEVGSWLLTAGWALIDAGTALGAIRTRGIKDWPRTSTKNLNSTLQRVRDGEYGAKEFAELEKALGGVAEASDDDEEEV